MLLALKAKIALAVVAGFATPFAVAPVFLAADRTGSLPPPAMVEIAPGRLDYRMSGEFTRDGRQVAAPKTTLRFDRSLSIMLHQVSAADYQACVDDGGCRASAADGPARADLPAVQVSWRDATDYAAWLSRGTGANYRLPTDAEWAYAAGRRFTDDGLLFDGDDPSVRWLARYERESERDDLAVALRGFGGFGANERGVLDLAGNVWEWTSTCFARTVLDEHDRPRSQTANCGVRIAEGRHRAYISDFVRDAKAGGCAAGLPPVHLGFRLVREPDAPLAALRARLTGASFSARS